MGYKSTFCIYLGRGDTKTLEVAGYSVFHLFQKKTEFLSIFGKNVSSLHSEPIIYNDIIKSNIEKFVDHYAESNPPIQTLRTYFKGVKEGEPFFIIPDVDSFTKEQELDLLCKVEAFFRKDPSVDIRMKFLLEDCNSSYAVEGGYGGSRVVLGNRKYCRFCKRTKEKGATFSKEAHAISIALGNKNIIGKEECDGCNNDFSETIEPDIVTYLSIERTLFRIKGRNKGRGGEKDVVGRNFSMKFENDYNSFRLDLIDPNGLNFIGGKCNFDLNFGQICEQNIYRALCKYFISVIPEIYLEKFENTIDWINRNVSLENLPIVARYPQNNMNHQQPFIIYHIRTNDNVNLPYAFCELYFANLLFVYIIPLSSEQEIDFTVEENFYKFWNSKEARCFNYFVDWEFKSFANDEPINFIRTVEIDEKTKDINLLN